MSLDESMITVTGLVSAMAVPAYSPATHSCQGDRLQRDDLREVCRGVAQAFENGDTVITEMIGVAIAKRVWPEGSDGWNAALERRRVYEYRTALWQPPAAGHLGRAGDPTICRPLSPKPQRTRGDAGAINVGWEGTGSAAELERGARERPNLLDLGLLRFAWASATRERRMMQVHATKRLDDLVQRVVNSDVQASWDQGSYARLGGLTAGGI